MKIKRRLAGYVRLIRREIAFYGAVAADPQCPRAARWLLGVAVAYALSPIDIIPDCIPGIGYLDDLLILPLLVWLAVRLIPKEVLREHRSALNVIDQAFIKTPEGG